MAGSEEKPNFRRVAVFTGDIVAAPNVPDGEESQPSVHEPSSIGRVARAAFAKTVEQLNQEPEAPPNMAT